MAKKNILETKTFKVSSSVVPIHCSFLPNLSYNSEDREYRRKIIRWISLTYPLFVDGCCGLLPGLGVNPAILMPFHQQAMVACHLANVLIHFSHATVGMVFHPWRNTRWQHHSGSGQKQHHMHEDKHDCHLSRTIFPRNMDRLGYFLWTKRQIERIVV